MTARRDDVPSVVAVMARLVHRARRDAWTYKQGATTSVVEAVGRGEAEDVGGLLLGALKTRGRGLQ